MEWFNRCKVFRRKRFKKYLNGICAVRVLITAFVCIPDYSDLFETIQQDNMSMKCKAPIKHNPGCSCHRMTLKDVAQNDQERHFNKEEFCTQNGWMADLP